MVGRNDRSVGPSFVRTVGPFVRFYGRSVVCLFGQLVGWSFYLRFGRSFGCYLVCSFSQHDYIRLFVHLVQCSLFRFFVQSSIRLCSFVIVRVLVLPVVSSSVRFFCSFVCCFHAWLYPPRMLPSEMLLWIMSPPCDENWWRKDWKQCDLKTLLITTSTPTLPPLNFLVHLVVSVWVSHRVGPQRSLTGNEREVKVNWIHDFLSSFSNRKTRKIRQWWRPVRPRAARWRSSSLATGRISFRWGLWRRFSVQISFQLEKHPGVSWVQLLVLSLWRLWNPCWTGNRRKKFQSGRFTIYGNYNYYNCTQL